MAGNRGVFVRLMERPTGDDPAASVHTIERTLDLLTDWPVLNEFKHLSPGFRALSRVIATTPCERALRGR
jgi:hypothetical protein